MRAQLFGPIALTVLTFFAASARADDDENARLREMLHRTQEALRQAQADNATLTDGKLEAEHRLEDSAKQLDTVKTKSLKAQSAKAAALQSQLETVHTAQENAQHRLDEANDKLSQTTTKLNEVFRQLVQRDAEAKALKVSLDESRTQIESCEKKNVTLYGFAQETLQRYKNKGVWASLSQKEPVFGLKEVDVENVVQEYQLKFESQKVKP